VDEVVFSYSDVSHEQVMHLASTALAGGADFRLLGGKATMLESAKPVVAVCAVRTGSGKSQTTRRVCQVLQGMGKRVVAVRHPMPYGDLVKQAVQRFSSLDDLDKAECTIEEREEYEPHIQSGVTVFAGVDYERILRAAEKESDVIVWDGGNNDLPFYRPTVHIVIADPHRAGHETRYHPGEANLKMADVVVINKVGTAAPDKVEEVRKAIRANNPGAKVIEADSPIAVEGGERLRGKRVLVIEDGPTVTHGDMAYGAGFLAAVQHGATIVDPRPFAVGSLKAVFAKYPHLKDVLPAMGYGRAQVEELERTINKAPVDYVVEGTPITLERILKSEKEIVKVTYSLKERGPETLETILKQKLG
jgi:predicted GTPase